LAKAKPTSLVTSARERAAGHGLLVPGILGRFLFGISPAPGISPEQTERYHIMFMHKYPAVIALALGALLVPGVGRAPTAAAQGAATFANHIPFSFAQLEFPEGVAVDKVGNVYVGIRQSPLGPLPFSDQIWKFSPSGDKTILASFDPPGGGGCGLAVDAKGNVYMARTETVWPNNGVYRVDAEGNIGPVPGTENIIFPDGLAFDQRGNLYITEVYSHGAEPSTFGQGGIWRVPKGGTAELWLRHDLLTGLPPVPPFSHPTGANGIGFYLGSLYVINTDKALVVQVPVLPDGSPGEPEVWAEVEDKSEFLFYRDPRFPLMLDGLALDVHGNVYIAVPSRLAVVRINAADRSQETLAVFQFMPVDVPLAPLDAPFSLAFGTGKGERQNLFVTSSGLVGALAPGLPWPGPGLVKLEIRIPGLPLP
jgi:sugar lactone lactonase YvrE